MAVQQHFELISRLTAKTAKGEVDWKPSADANAFQVAFRRNTVRLIMSQFEDAESHPAYTIEILDQSGAVVDEFSDYDLDNDQFGRANQGNYRAMRDLFDRARRRALGADKVLNDVLEELGDEDDIPF